MNEAVKPPNTPELIDPLPVAASAARQMLGGGNEIESTPSPEDRLSGGLAQELYATAIDLGERTLPLGTQQPYVELPYYELPEQQRHGDFFQRSLSFDPNVRGVTHNRSSANMSRATTLRITTDTPPGSFRAETDVEDRGRTYRIGLDYVAPDPDTQAPGQILFFDSRFTDANQTHLPHEDPRRQNVLDHLLSDIALVEEAVTEFENAEITGEHVRKPLDYRELVDGDVDVIFFGESHYHTSMMGSIARGAKILYESGVRAVCLEASSDQDFSDLNSGDFSRLDADELDIGPGLALISPKIYQRLGEIDPITDARKEMIKALVTNGVHIVPVDSARHIREMQALSKAVAAGLPRPSPTVTQVERETDIATNRDRAVAQYKKIVHLIGRNHTKKGTFTYHSGPLQGKPYKLTAQYAIDHGHKVRSIHFHGSNFYGAERNPDPILVANGWGNMSYMYRPADSDPLASGSPDWIVYIPPSPFEAENSPELTRI